MARVRQFAKDMGITYNQAKGLINKGRSRKDGGSQILENVMKKQKGYKLGGSETNPKAPVAEVKKTKLKKIVKKKDKDPFAKDTTVIINEKFSKDVAEANKKAMQEVKKKKEGGANSLKPIPADAKGLQALKLKRPDVVADMGYKKKGGTLKMRDGGTFRGCGAQVKGKKFKGIF